MSLVVHVDKREPREIVKHLGKLKVSSVVEILPADYWIPTTVENGISFLVERKTVLDLAKSIKDKRIWSQLRTLVSTCNSRNCIPLLIVEGSLSKLEILTEWSPIAVTSILLMAKFKYGVELFFVPSMRWTAITLTSLARMAQIKKEKKPEKLRKEKRPEEPHKLLQYIVESFPGVGPSTAVNLLLKFGSIQNIANATLQELYHVEGIGKKKAKEIYNILRLDYRELVKEETGIYLDNFE